MVEVKVEGMTCGHCEAAVKRAITRVPGVERVVEVSHEQGRVVVEGEPDIAALVAAIEDEGYRAEAAG
jgi:copper chaperone